MNDAIGPFSLLRESSFTPKVHAVQAFIEKGIFLDSCYHFYRDTTTNLIASWPNFVYFGNTKYNNFGSNIQAHAYTKSFMNCQNQCGMCYEIRSRMLFIHFHHFPKNHLQIQSSKRINLISSWNISICFAFHGIFIGDSLNNNSNCCLEHRLNNFFYCLIEICLNRNQLDWITYYSE